MGWHMGVEHLGHVCEGRLRYLDTSLMNCLLSETVSVTYNVIEIKNVIVTVNEILTDDVFVTYIVIETHNVVVTNNIIVTDNVI